MPAALTYPGVYIEELPSGVRTITGVATSITAFIGSALRGPTDEPVRVQSFAEFERAFGGLGSQHPRICRRAILSQRRRRRADRRPQTSRRPASIVRRLRRVRR